ncbi:MAG: fibronectin type III domain-containing protein [Caldilineaceae bacterium]|nr:fibronectin type III domain-containing protein [Caldilineaceae bacterium]
MELMTYKTRAVRTLSLLILVALLAALNPPSITGGVALGQGATVPVLTANADTANQVDISWTEVAGATEYSLWRYQHDTERWAPIDTSIEGTTYTDTTVVAGKTYTYQVSADGEQTWSDREQGHSAVTVGAYDASTVATPSATSSMISLSWSMVTGATSYELWRYDNSWGTVGGTITATSYSDSAVEIGKTYYYQVRAKGPNGDGAWSNRVNATVPTTTPGAPQNFSASPGDGQATLSWDAPLSNGGSAITSYEYRYQMSGGSWSNWMDNGMSRTATVGSLTNESAHNFEVRAENANGAGLVASDTATPMSTVPGIPAGLGVTSTGPTEITLSWTAVDGAASYQLQRRTNGGAWGSPMDAGSGTSYTDMDLAPSTTYDYEVRAVNAAGNSGWSGVVTSATTAPEAPDAVSDLDAMASADKITLTWSMPDGNGAAISGYEIEVSDDDSSWSDLATLAATATSYEHMNLGPGTMKYYRISAMNSVGTSAWSASAMATVAAVAPGKPTLYASPGDGMIMLSWVAPAATGGAAITGYTIQVSNNGTTGWGTLAAKAADATSHDHTGLAPGTTRYYRISATNSAGTGEWSDVQSATIGGARPPAGEAPDGTSPQNLRTAADSLTGGQGTSTASITLNWDAPTSPPDDDDGTTTLTYEVEVWNSTTQTWGSVMNDTTDDNVDNPMVIAPTVDPTTLAGTLQDTGLMGVTEYIYRVRAVDGTGATAVRGKWTAQVSRETVAVSPGKPTLKATKMGTDKILLEWSVSDDGGSDIVGYILQVGTAANAIDNYLNASGTNVGTTVTMLPAAQQMVTQMDIDPGTQLFYQITALNGVASTADLTSANAAWSTPSDVAMATTDTGVPGVPTFTVVGGAGTFDINFENLDANNGGSAYTSHEFQVWDADDEQWVVLQDNTSTTLAPPTGLAANVTMYYRARSKNANGAGPWKTTSGTTAPGAASAPKLTATVNGEDSITLSWTVPENDGGNDITDYVLQMSATNTEDGSFTVDVTAGSGITADDVTGDSRTATHTGLTAGVTRHYRVQATDGTTPGAWSNIVSATTTSGGVPGAPTWGSPALTPAGTTITINWVAPTSDGGSAITGYDIAMWENGAWTIIASNIATTPVQYVESGLAGATTYYFSVRARNVNGAGPWSVVQSAATEAGAPGEPVLTVMPDGDKKIVLTWTEPDSGGRSITGYLVQVSNNGTAGWGPLSGTETPAADDYQNTADLTNIGIATNVTRPTGSTEPAQPLTVTHDGLSGMTKRFYRVLAHNGDVGTATNLGMWSDVKYATTPAGVPAKVVLADAPATEESDKITVSWTAPMNGGSAITGYQVQVWSDGAWMDLMSVGGSATSYTHENLPGATTRHYRVRAMNAVGYGDWSDPQERTTATGKPGAPVLHADHNGSSQIRLTWTAPASGGAAGTVTVNNYQIQVSNDGQSGWNSPEASPTDPLNNTIVGGERVLQTSAGTSPDTTQNYTDMGLDPATTRYYRVRAVNSNNATVGPWSNVAMATTTGGKPGRPTLTATASGTSMIMLAWEAPEGDGGSPITGYEIEYWDGSNGWMNLTNPAATATSYTHRNVGGGMTKFYRIRAMNSAGNGFWSTTAHATTETTVPAPPSLEAMADGATKIKLSWTAGHDGGLSITAYYLQHSSDGGRSWADLGDAMMDMMMMSYEDTMGLSGGTTKHYRIRAVNSKGSSGWSPLAMATTDRSAPSKPDLNAVGLGNGRIFLDWTAKDGGSTIIRYELQRWDSANRRWMDLRSTTSTIHTDTGREEGKRHFYRVRAVNAIGTSDWSTLVGSDSARPTN